jgi:hypothetical protein
VQHSDDRWQNQDVLSTKPALGSTGLLCIGLLPYEMSAEAAPRFVIAPDLPQAWHFSADGWQCIADEPRPGQPPEQDATICGCSPWRFGRVDWSCIKGNWLGATKRQLQAPRARDPVAI